MEPKIGWCIAIVVWVVEPVWTGGASSIKGEDCYSKNDLPGKCVTFPECTPYFKLLRKRPISKADLREIVNLTCVFDHYDPLICCPLRDILQENLNTRISTAPKGRLSHLPTYAEHPKFKLLPSISECSIRKGDEFYRENSRVYRGHFPWAVLLGYFNPRSDTVEYLCGATVINSRYVLTAAHCSGKADGLKPIFVRVAEHDLINDPDCSNEIGKAKLECSYAKNIGIEEVVPHPKFNYADRSIIQNHDIALIRLAEPLVFNDFIRPVCLPFISDYKLYDFPEKLEDAEISIVAGWGKSTRRLQGLTVIRTRSVRIKSPQQCSVPYFSKRSVLSDQICADGNSGECAADSGGALMIASDRYLNPPKLIQVGVTSFGPKYCQWNVPNVYIRVSKYLKWILDSLEP